MPKKNKSSQRSKGLEESIAHIAGPVQRKQLRMLRHASQMTERDPRVFLKHVTDEVGTQVLQRAADVEFNPRLLSHSDLEALEAIVVEDGRPVILIQNGKLQDVSGNVWSERIAASLSQIESNLTSVGRIEVTGHSLNTYFDPDEDLHLGSCAVLSPNTVLTNRHVAVEFCNPDGSIKNGMTACVDFVEEYGRDPDLEFNIIRAIDIGYDFDYAVLEVEAATPLPPSLSLVDSALEASACPFVYIVGYPAFDSRNPTDVQNRIFDGLYNVKRFAPGRLVSIESEPSYVSCEQRDLRLICDYTSLGGNSGSPIFDLQTNKIIGLHFAGRYGEGNYAVPIWTIRDRIDAAVKSVSSHLTDAHYFHSTGGRRPMSSSLVDSLLKERAARMPVGIARNIATHGFNRRSASETLDAAAAAIVLDHFGVSDLKSSLCSRLTSIHPALGAACSAISASECFYPGGHHGPTDMGMGPSWARKEYMQPPFMPGMPGPTFPPIPRPMIGAYEPIDARCIAGTVGGGLAGVGGFAAGPAIGAATTVGGALTGAAQSGCFD